ncbi:unnamed protein product [Microthlaspi erraticum]|uniref:Integrase catalytic domain-containing protein n=1 Tax=Microthlaspi erraticum TaxID=1685480 RepID=A0A6D2IIK8_9BRAS|nr:unnamed protein product [Microthlaspi erraticum]
MAERQFGKQVKAILSDNGTEFMCLSSYFQEHGILHQTSCVDTPQQNGRVERKHRHILNVAHACLFQAQLPVTFWGESILAATHLINRTPTRVLDGKSPYEILFGKPPTYDLLCTFGCLCYAHHRARDKDKFGPRSRKCIFVGYPYGKKGWRLYDLEKDQFFVSRDVQFQENVFPFHLTVTESSPATPLLSPDAIIDDDWNFTPPLIPPLVVIPSTTETEPPPEPVIEPNTVITPAVSALESTETDNASNHEETPPPSPGLPELLGRGHRSKKTSVLLKDFVTQNVHYSPSHALSLAPSDSKPSQTVSGKTLYPLTKYLSDIGFTAHHIAFMAAVLDSEEPQHFKDAILIKEWCEAMKKEIEALEGNHTWDIVDLPPGKTAIGSKWVYKLKFNTYGSLERHKARLVAMGNREQEGIDFKETFAPVVKLTTVRHLLAVAAAKDWEVH